MTQSAKKGKAYPFSGDAYKVRGKEYHSILSPQERAMVFIEDMELKLENGMLTSPSTMLECAKIYFKVELMAVRPEMVEEEVRGFVS
jgi:hypothetical protein